MRQNNLSLGNNQIHDIWEAKLFLCRLFDSQVSARLLMRSEREAVAGEEPSHTCCPQWPTQLADYKYFTASSPPTVCQPSEWPNMCQKVLHHLKQILWTMFLNRKTGCNFHPAKIDHLLHSKMQVMLNVMLGMLGNTEVCKEESRKYIHGNHRNITLSHKNQVW